MFSKRKSVDLAGQRRASSVRETLSGLVRLGRGLARKPTLSALREARHDRPSLDESPKPLPVVQVKDFGSSRLEIDLHSLEAFRGLAPGSPKDADTHKKPQKASAPAAATVTGATRTATSTTTPIADMFARRSSLLSTPPMLAMPSLAMPSLAQSSPSLLMGPAADNPVRASVEGRRPVQQQQQPATRPASPAASAAAAPEVRRRGSRASSVVHVEIVSAGQAQSHTPRPWPPPEPAPVRIVGKTPSGSRPPTRIQLREPRRLTATSSSPGPVVAAAVAAASAPAPEPAAATSESITRSRQNSFVAAQRKLLMQEITKRHSTPNTMPSLTISTAPDPQPSADKGPADRRRSWQPASAVSTPRSSAPPSASAPWRGLQNTGPAARPSGRRLSSDRLAFLRDMEEGKKKAAGSGDLPALKAAQGSVADKLARFESKQLQQPQLASLTRSNSTRSRTSSVADTFASTSFASTSFGGAATSRSSLDSHRTSSVFSHYDESFRERMERITANANQKADDQGKPDTTRVSSTFVAVDRGVMQ